MDFLAGCLGGCAGVLVGHPLDTAKVHLQTQDAKNPVYRGTFHCLKTIAQRDSVRGLYRGMSSPMAGVAFVNAIVFGVYGNVQRYTSNPDSIKSHFLAGATAGLVQSFICSPMELAKTRLQLQHNCSATVIHSGPLHVLNYIRKTEGFRGMFRGLGITAARDVPGFASYFVSYELMTGLTEEPTPLVALFAGGLAGTFSWLVTFPIDVVKSRFQADGMTGKPEYSGIKDCIKKGYQSEGLSFFSRGLGSSLIRAFPMNAACFFVVSLIMRITEKADLDVELQQTEPLGIVGPMAAPPFAHHHQLYQHDDSHEARYKRQVVRSLVFLGAFSEAVCSSEIIELANGLYDDHQNNNYYNFNADKFISSSNLTSNGAKDLETTLCSP